MVEILIPCCLVITFSIYRLYKNQDFEEGDYLTFFSEPEYEFINKKLPIYKVLKVGKKTYLLQNIRVNGSKHEEHFKSHINNCYKKVDHND